MARYAMEEEWTYGTKNRVWAKGDADAEFSSAAPCSLLGNSLLPAPCPLLPAPLTLGSSLFAPYSLLRAPCFSL
jgi:hypothetical protein